MSGSSNDALSDELRRALQPGRQSNLPEHPLAWQELVDHAQSSRVVVQALTPERCLSRGVNEPVIFYCSDGRRYVVKGIQAGRRLVAEHICARLGELLEAPIPRVALVDVPYELTVDSSMAAHFEAGLAHGSEFVADCRDSRHCECIAESDNIPRYAALAVLNGLVEESDHQYLFKKRPPMLMYSVDHDRCLPGAGEWSLDDLAFALQQPTLLDQRIVSNVSIPQHVISDSVARLYRITNDRITEIVASVPFEWGLTLEERAGLGRFLSCRRDQLIAQSS